jgi:SAM-dependent methyltransferase
MTTEQDAHEGGAGHAHGAAAVAHAHEGHGHGESAGEGHGRSAGQGEGHRHSAGQGEGHGHSAGHGEGNADGHTHSAGHGHGHEHEEITEEHFTQTFWDDRYSSAERLWSGQPNPQIVAQTSGLTPGTALDAGCGEGADAIWLASRGWTVTAVDVSAVALERGARHASDQGAEVAARIAWQREDLLTWDPGAQRFDLVSAHYMHLPGELFEGFFGRLAAAVRPGGTLLVVGHHPDDMHANVGRPGHLGRFPKAQDMGAALDPGEWTIEVTDAFERPATDVDGAPTTVKDTVLKAARRR